MKKVKFLIMLSIFCWTLLLFSVIVSAKETRGTLTGSNIQWIYDDGSETLTLIGDGNSVLSDDLSEYSFSSKIETLVLDGIKSYTILPTVDHLVLGKDFLLSESTNSYDILKYSVPDVTINYKVDDDNPYYADYDGALYNKELTELIRVPTAKREIQLANTLEKIDKGAFTYSSIAQVIIPWGVTDIEKYGIEFFRRDYEDTETYMYVILPDTVQSLGEVTEYTACRIIISENNTAIYYSDLYQKGGSYPIQNNITSWNPTFQRKSNSEFYAAYYGITSNSFKTFGDKTYYFDENCKMVTGTVTIDGKTYTFDENGVLQSQTATVVKSGLIYQDGKAYYYENGVMQKSKWVYADGYWYYLNDYGAGVVNCWRLMDGKYYYLGVDGKMKTNCWIQDYGSWYYVKADGSRYESSWAKINGAWYWFGGSGKMAENQWLKLADGKWYYFTGSGAMAANRWVKSGAYWYYLGSNGAMLTNTTTPDGYRVDNQGRWK